MTAADGDFVQAAGFDDAGNFAYAYATFTPAALGLARLDPSGGSFARTTVAITDPPRTGNVAFDADGTAYVATAGASVVTLYAFADAGPIALATVAVDPGISSAFAFPRGGEIYVALLTPDDKLFKLYHREGDALVDIAVPEVARASVTQGDDGALYIGFLDDRADMAATVQQVHGHDLVDVGIPGFARYPIEVPYVRAVGSDLYVTVENDNLDQPGFDLICHGPTCLAPKPPAPASAAQCVTHSGATLICTEWNHADEAQQNSLLNECLPANGQFARTRCDTANVVGGCRSTEVGELVVTDWYYGPPTGNDTEAVVRFLCMQSGKLFVPPGS
ncbi:MAG: hypothetical protein NT062_09030 [Proteobacteria bacterium]|nr:hypothetical protein [Pseudomonadota bacterium]